MIHIGNKIHSVLKGKGLSISEFARRINTSRENVYGIFKRETLDTGLLLRINAVLDYDFFQYYNSKGSNIMDVANEDAAIYKTTTGKTKLLSIIKSLRDELGSVKEKLSLAQKEIDYLETINKLLEEKVKKG